MVTRKLLHYFTDHEVMVITSYPLGTSSTTTIPQDRSLSGHSNSWAMTCGSGAGVVLISLDKSRICYAICLHFLASNNAAEYKALINELRITIKLGAMRLYIRGDSELVVDQVMKESSYKSSLMAAYCQEVHKLEDKFQGIELHHVP
ncbi:uncharacterized protein [Miscanthus floridulus]|uniref:uncharacterized protein n=1 Tax=Miscanthus floridulus TaxID=154761 RepID=UPI00345982FD